MDPITAVEAVEAQSLSHPQNPSGEEANMVATPAVDAVEAQSLSHPQNPSSEEANMVTTPAVAVAESGEVSPSSPSTPDTSPRNGGSGAKAGQNKAERRTTFEKNAATALRIKNEGYETAIAAMFVKSTAAAKKAAEAMEQPLTEAEAGQRVLTQLSSELADRINRLLGLCRFIGIDLDTMFTKAAVTLSELKTRKVPQVTDAALRLADYLTAAKTAAPEELRHEAKLLFKSAKACSEAYQTTEDQDRTLVNLRQALAAAIKASSEDLTLLAAELRHTDARYGTRWSERLLMRSAPSKRKTATTEPPSNTDPATLKAEGAKSA